METSARPARNESALSELHVNGSTSLGAGYLRLIERRPCSGILTRTRRTGRRLPRDLESSAQANRKQNYIGLKQVVGSVGAFPIDFRLIEE